MIDSKDVARLVFWQLERRWIASLTVLLSCVAIAVFLTQAASFKGRWIVMNLTIVALAAGFVRRRSQGWSRWSQRLPVDPHSVLIARFSSLISLALPALLAGGMLSAAPDSRWALCARSFAWLLCLGVALLAPMLRVNRWYFFGLLAMWLIVVESSLVSQTFPLTWIVAHDLALATVTVGFVFTGGVQRLEANRFGGTITVVWLILLLREAPWVILILYLYIACIGLSVLFHSGLIPRSAHALTQDLVVLIVAVAVFAALAWYLVQVGGAWSGTSPGDEGATATAVAEDDRGSEAMSQFRGNLKYAIGRGPWVTTGGVMAFLLLGWMAVLIRAEQKRISWVDRWLRQRSMLERLPISRGQVIERAIMPQLRVAATHGLLILALGLIAGMVHLFFELEGIDVIWRRGAMVFCAGLAYLLVAQIFTFRRGLDRLPWIAVVVMMAIALWISVDTLAWSLTLSVSIIGALAVLSVRLSTLWVRSR